MAYLPFYLTPEELSAYQEAQEQKISSVGDVLRWSVVNVEMPSRYIHIYFTLVPLCVCIAIFLALANFDQTDDTIFLACVLSSCVTLFYFLMRWGLIKQYHYVFSEKGLVAKSHSTIPKWMNNASQVTGWVGATVCILMVILVGPMALAGAGAFILVSFKMLKRQPDERTEVKVGEREDWLFADYNKKRKVIQFYVKHDICRYRDTAHKTIFRSQDRSDCYVFFKTEADLESMVAQLSKVYKLNCTEVDDHKKLFEAKPESRLFSIPVCSKEYQTDEVFDLRASNAPLPEREYLYNGKWQTESEIEQSKPELTTAKE
ncbi:hypothetical protein K0W38_000701 [Vibrio vulnificus]|uniref:hypothetical protein n=1 Tax=Vibrio vulnificus TaxID=672 RepID=UPI001D5AA2AA|nr:hypothetical protein [Vibrio vulnificus]